MNETQEQLEKLRGVWRKIEHKMGKYYKLICGHVVEDEVGIPDDSINAFCTQCNPDLYDEFALENNPFKTR